MKQIVNENYYHSNDKQSFSQVEYFPAFKVTRVLKLIWHETICKNWFTSGGTPFAYP